MEPGEQATSAIEPLPGRCHPPAKSLAVPSLQRAIVVRRMPVQLTAGSGKTHETPEAYWPPEAGRARYLGSGRPVNSWTPGQVLIWT